MNRVLESIYVFGSLMGEGIKATAGLLVLAALMPLFTVAVACGGMYLVLSGKEVEL